MIRQTQIQVPEVTSCCYKLLGGLYKEGRAVPSNASMALAMSARTPSGVQLSVYSDNASRQSEQAMTSRYLAFGWHTLV